MNRPHISGIFLSGAEARRKGVRTEGRPEAWMFRHDGAGRAGPNRRRTNPIPGAAAAQRCLLVSALVGFAACDEPGDERLDRLNAAWARWRATGSADYRFDYRRSCFCPVVEEVRISVADGIVVQVTSRDTGEPIPEARYADFPTIDGLFVELDQLIGADPHLLEVEYDLDYGYPAAMEVDIEERIADEEFAYTVRDFTILPAGIEALESEVRP